MGRGEAALAELRRSKEESQATPSRGGQVAGRPAATPGSRAPPTRGARPPAGTPLGALPSFGRPRGGGRHGQSRSEPSSPRGGSGGGGGSRAASLADQDSFPSLDYGNDDDSSRSADNVRVLVRVRPLNERERREGGPPCVSVSGQAVIVTDAARGEPVARAYDHVFGPEAGQEEVHAVAGASAVGHCLQGFNASIFAYGQTGSGKTYTMQGGEGPLARAEDGGLPLHCGLVPRVFDLLFRRVPPALGPLLSARMRAVVAWRVGVGAPCALLLGRPAPRARVVCGLFSVAWRGDLLLRRGSFVGGLLSRVSEEEQANDNVRYSVKCSFLEVYNEDISDLLQPSNANLQEIQKLKLQSSLALQELAQEKAASARLREECSQLRADNRSLAHEAAAAAERCGVAEAEGAALRAALEAGGAEAKRRGAELGRLRAEADATRVALEAELKAVLAALDASTASVKALTLEREELAAEARRARRGADEAAQAAAAAAARMQAENEELYRAAQAMRRDAEQLRRALSNETVAVAKYKRMVGEISKLIDWAQQASSPLGGAGAGRGASPAAALAALRPSGSGRLPLTGGAENVPASAGGAAGPSPKGGAGKLAGTPGQHSSGGGLLAPLEAAAAGSRPSPGGRRRPLSPTKLR
eukprot:scaffold15.g4346.t1